MSCRICCRQRVLSLFASAPNLVPLICLLTAYCFASRILLSLPVVTQHLLVLLFGTFRAIANSSESSNTGMTSEAISISVAPSFFQSCVSEGNKFAKIEDVQRFKVSFSTCSIESGSLLFAAALLCNHLATTGPTLCLLLTKSIYCCSRNLLLTIKFIS